MNCVDLYPAFEKSNIPVVVASSNLYAPYAGVFLKSLINHSSAEKNYDIIIFQRDISQENRRLLLSLINGLVNFSIRFCDLSQLEGQSELPTGGHLSAEVYYKIMAPFMLPHYDKIVVVDVDTLLKTDIAQLYEEDLNGYCVGAVISMSALAYCENEEYARDDLLWETYYREILEMTNPREYVNSGVLLIDCEQYRKCTSVEQIFDAAKKKEVLIADQCTLNHLFCGKIKFLDMKWNADLAVNEKRRWLFASVPDEIRQMYAQACDNAYILHWAHKPKPWECPDVVYGNEWWQVALETPFMGGILSRMMDWMIHRNEYYANNKYNRVPELWSDNPLKLDPNRHKKRNNGRNKNAEK